jgi:hypothetical protein
MAAAEQKKSYQVNKAFRTLNTKANRTAIRDDEFSWLENAMPIGDSNMRVVPGKVTVTDSGGNAVVWSNAVTTLGSFNLNTNDYIAGFQANGAAEYFNLDTLTKGTIAVAGTFSSSNVTFAQWQNQNLMILDPQKGLFTYNSNGTVFVGSVGAIGIQNGGSGYTSAPAVTISAPNNANGTQAVATATISGGVVSSITLTEAGTGYNASPTISFTGGGGSGAIAVASFATFANGTVYCVIQSGGTGYTNASNITFTFTGGGGTGANAAATIGNGAITSVIMTNPGTGYTSNPTVTIAGGAGNNAVIQAYAVTNAAVDVASFSGRVWVAQGRSVAYTTAGTFNNFVGVSAGAVAITDSTLHNTIRSLLSANNFLYIYGDDSINVFSDVRVTTTGTTLFTNTNLSASVGSSFVFGLFPYFRSVLFQNNYGVYALVGSTTSKLSDPLDGIFPYIDFSKPVTSGQVLLYNILCGAFNFYYNGPIGSPRYLQAIFFDKKWFVTSNGDVKYITSTPHNGNVILYGTGGTDLVQLYGNTSADVSATIQTALMSMGDPIRTKQAIRMGVEATLSNSASLNVTVDSESGSGPVITKSNASQGWINNLGNPITWTNNVGSTIAWLVSGGYYLYWNDAEQWGKYLGLTVTSNSSGYTINTFELEHEFRVRF